MKTYIAQQQSVSATGPLDAFDIADVDVRSGDWDWTLNLRITSLTASSGSPSITLAIEVSYDSFATVFNSVSVSAEGPVSHTADVVNSWRAYQFGETGMGVGYAGAQMRVNVTALNGTAILDVWLDS